VLQDLSHGSAGTTELAPFSKTFRPAKVRNMMKQRLHFLLYSVETLKSLKTQNTFSITSKHDEGLLTAI